MQTGDKVVYIDKKEYRRKKINQLPAKKILFFLAFAVAILLFIFLFSERLEVIEARHGELIDGFGTEALLIRDETVFKAPVSGNVDFEKYDGERVSHGDRIITIDAFNVYCQKPGIISFSTDGLEDLLRPENIGLISTERFSDFERDFQQLSRGSYVNEGQTLYRIANNFVLYLMFNTTTKEAERYSENEVVFVKTGNEERLFRGRVKNITTNQEESLLTIKLENFLQEWLDLRWVDIKFIKNIYRGIVIPQSAVFNQPQGRGVLVVDPRGEYYFREIEIKFAVDEKLIVDNVNNGDRIIANPEVVNYGRED